MMSKSSVRQNVMKYPFEPQAKCFDTLCATFAHTSSSSAFTLCSSSVGGMVCEVGEEEALFDRTDDMLRVAAQRLAQRATSFAGAAARPTLVSFARHYADDANLLKTALYDFHLEMGGKMVSYFCVCVVGLPVVKPRVVIHFFIEKEKKNTRARPSGVTTRARPAAPRRRSEGRIDVTGV